MPDRVSGLDNKGHIEELTLNVVLNTLNQTPVHLKLAVKLLQRCDKRIKLKHFRLKDKIFTRVSVKLVEMVITLPSIRNVHMF